MLRNYLASALLLGTAAPALGQGDATALIAQITKTFAPSLPVSSVKLTGSVVWHSGTDEDTGPVTITANSDGSQTFTAQLAASGERSEAQTAIGEGMSCQWARSDGAEHSNDNASCQKSMPWAVPALALQAARIPALAGYVDLGSATLNATSYRHLQGQLLLAGLPARLLPQAMAASTVDAFVDPKLFDLGAIRYKVHADDNPALSIDVEIRYGQITPVNGVRIPFHIERYINGTLQLEINIASAQIS